LCFGLPPTVTILKLKYFARCYFCFAYNYLGDVYTAFTLSDYRYDYAWFQPAYKYVEFKVRACNDGHILLATSLNDETYGYEIVLGGYGNTASDIRRGSHGPILVQANTPDIMSCDEFLPFWIRWGSNSVEVGSGRLDNHVIMRLNDPDQPEIRAFSVSSWITAPAEYHFLQINGKSVLLFSLFYTHHINMQFVFQNLLSIKYYCNHPHHLRLNVGCPCLHGLDVSAYETPPPNLIQSIFSILTQIQ